MSTIPNTQNRHGTAGVSRRSGRRGQPWWLGRTMFVGPWLIVLVVAAALAASGCGGGEVDEAEPEEEEAAEEDPAAMGGPPVDMAPEPKPKAKQQAKAEEEAGSLPEEISEWVTDHYYQARKQRDPRLIEAVAYLGEHFAGSDRADEAAQLLTNLLEKSEEPEPKPGARRPGAGMPGGDPSMPGMEGPMPGMDETMAGPGMEEGYMPPEADMAGMEGDMAGMEGDPYGGAMPPGMEADPRASRMPGLGARPGARTPNVELIYAIVEALGVNGSDPAKKTLRQVVEDEFETDDNRAATLATLETLTAHLCPEYEDLLFRCLTTPGKLRPLGKKGQMGRPGGGMPYHEEPMMGPEMYSGTGMGRRGSGPLTAEELQRQAFESIRPKASEEFRTRIARHLANPQTPQEDLDLFGPYLRESHPDNLQAQMVLYLVPDMDQQTKETIEDHFLAYSSDALAGVLGIPEALREEIARRRELRQKRRPGYPGMPGMEEGYMPPEMEEHSAMGPGMEEHSAMGPEMAPMDEMGPGAPSGRPRSGRPSRYDTQSTSSRPSRYDDRPGAGGQPPEPDTFDASDPDLPFRLGQRMWGPEMIELVDGRLAKAGSLEEQAPLVLLASTMPVDSIRSSLHRLLQQRWQDGPGALESAGLYDQVISDPAFLALVKMLPRKAVEEPKRAVPRLSRMRNRRNGGGPEAPRGAPDMAAGMPGDMEAMDMEGGMGPPGAGRGQGKPQEPDLAWMAASEELVRVMCERLHGAAQGTGGQGGEGLPFEVRDDALVTAELHLDWPGNQPEKLTGVSLGQTKLHYLRAECQTKIGTLESYFRRQLGSPEIRSIQDGSWIDSVQTVPDTNVKRSIDLLLTATVPAGQQLDKKAELPVTLDILCIDIQDPGDADN